MQKNVNLPPSSNVLFVVSYTLFIFKPSFCCDVAYCCLVDVQEANTQGKEGLTCSESTRVDISSLSISHSNMEKDTGFTSYLLNNRFRVYRRFPDIAFSQGITVLPISEDKWVAVSLEFPNERDDWSICWRCLLHISSIFCLFYVNFLKYWWFQWLYIHEDTFLSSFAVFFVLKDFFSIKLLIPRII